MKTRSKTISKDEFDELNEWIPGVQRQRFYESISYEKRVKLINLAGQKGYSISRAARELGIKLSTGKFIVKRYREKGLILNKNQIQEENLEDISIKVSREDLPKKTKSKVQARNQPINSRNNEISVEGVPLNSVQQFPNINDNLLGSNMFWSNSLAGNWVQPIIFYPNTYNNWADFNSFVRQ